MGEWEGNAPFIDINYDATSIYSFFFFFVAEAGACQNIILVCKIAMIKFSNKVLAIDSKFYVFFF